MNIRGSLSADYLRASQAESPADRIPATQVALYAYKFFFRHFWQAARAIVLPMVAAGFVLYGSLGLYLSQLLSFLGDPNPRVASLALETLAAGFFVSLFFYAVAIVAISDLALGRRRIDAGWPFHAERQEWRVYAACLRFLLILSVMLAALCALSIYAGRALLIPSWLPAVLGIAATYWLFARIGFVMAPVVAGSQGPILRRAWQMSGSHLWRNCALIALLILPGLALQVSSEYIIRWTTGKPVVGGNLPLADSARLMGDTLAGFVAAASLSLSMTIVLVTVGAIAAYRVKSSRDSEAGPKREGHAPSLAASVLAEKLPK